MSRLIVLHLYHTDATFKGIIAIIPMAELSHLISKLHDIIHMYILFIRTLNNTNNKKLWNIQCGAG